MTPVLILVDVLFIFVEVSRFLLSLCVFILYIILFDIEEVMNLLGREIRKMYRTVIAQVTKYRQDYKLPDGSQA